MRTLKHLGVALVAASSLIPSAALAAQDPAPPAQPVVPAQPADPAQPAAPVQPTTGAQPAPTTTQPSPAAAPAATDAKPTDPKAAEPSGVSLSLTTESPAPRDQASGETDKKKDEKKLAWRGSTLMFDQNMSSQTTHLDPATQQTYVGSYEWWISFRPRYYFTEKLNLNMRFDYYKDLTNAESTTYKHEDVFGDIWANLVYSLPKLSKHTEERVGLRALFPTSKESQAQGIYVTAGATGSISQDVPIRGEEAKYLNSAKFALSAAYTHPFSQSTNPANYGNFTYERQDLDGRATSSSIVSPGNVTNHQVLALIDGELAITPKLLLTLDFITINQWKYLPKDNVSIQSINGASTVVPRDPNATSFKQQVWFIASVGYDVVDEINLSLGYYNLTNALAPDGTRRGVIGANTVWWSPDARVFFDVTANLDKAYLWATGQKESQKKAAVNATRNRLNREVMHTTGTTISE